VLWGVWHWPLYVHGLADWPTAARLVVLHAALGIPMSMLARLAGSIGPPAVAHALIDAWRNLWGAY